MTTKTREAPAATRAYRRAWWAVVAVPVALFAAFGIGEGLLSAVAGDSDEPAAWQVAVAAIPALLVVLIPGVAAVWFGRRAVALGRPAGRLPMLLGGLATFGFVGLNLAAYLVGRGG